MKINYVILPNSLVVNFCGETHTIAKGCSRYNDIIKAIKENNLDLIPQLIKVVNQFTGIPGLEIKDNNVYLDGKILEGIVADRILQFKQENLPFEPLIAFARKLRKNPSYNSRLMLYKFLEHNGHPITSDGNFVAYRGVTSDFKDVHTRTFDNRVGSVCSMPREEVDENPNNTCSSGLHVACYRYAKGFSDTVVEVEVDPQDVVCVPTDYNGTKMRVCKFKVLNICENQRTESLYTTKSSIPEKQEFWNTVELGQSAVIRNAFYNKDSAQLRVELTSGDIYVYEGVPQEAVHSWEEAVSPGKYYNNHISYNYDYRKEF